MDILRRLAERLETLDWVNGLVFVSTATMPVIKFNGLGDVAVDLTCMGTTHHGIQSQQFIGEQLVRQPPLRPLALVLKQLLRGNGVADTLTGGLSSYGIVLMVSSFLQVHSLMCGAHGEGRGQSKQARWTIDSGSLLLEFLHQHTTQLDYSAMVFSARGGYTMRRPSRSALSMDVDLVIEDPFDRDANVAQGMYRLSQLRDVFAQASQGLQNSQPLHLAIGAKFAVPPVLTEGNNGQQFGSEKKKKSGSP